ncbi:MAG TPA: hypothetical protein PKE04_05765 [Clostridia bacterium]|nr:hypothetical protein [Clostridia bacterium]
MPDYKEMYRILFSETTKAISILQQAQQQTEEMYIADDTEEKRVVLIIGHSEQDKPSK